MLHGKGNSGGIKVTYQLTLRQGGRPELSRRGRCPHKGPYQWRTEMENVQ